ncbi:MAG TPA: hypothetical protein VG872_02980 [Acidimicrobiia bacterium]|jgi:hypothetical protein|nr:hypothetical protein [Acidimicrobiia bacterium]
MIDRRTYFFLGAALAVAAVQPLVPQFRWATLTVVAVYLVFAGLFAAADISARRAARRNGHL